MSLEKFEDIEKAVTVREAFELKLLFQDGPSTHLMIEMI